MKNDAKHDIARNAHNDDDDDNELQSPRTKNTSNLSNVFKFGMFYFIFHHELKTINEITHLNK
jgi:hypothetical protein